VSELLLATKIHIPSVRHNLVNRPHLIRRLNDGIRQGCRLTIVSAPAGYGKSTLLSEWAFQANCPVAWLSLEKGENTPARFWTYFLTALSNIPPLSQVCDIEAFIEALQSPQPPQMDILLANLLNAISYLKEHAVFVLDDLHTIKNDQINQDLVFLIEHLPRNEKGLHLILSSRMDPPWPLSRWRVRDELIEIRTADLRFTPEETGEFLSKIMQLNLSAEDVHTLENRTEGWIAGLQMAALSLQGRLKGQGPQGVTHFIQAFTGSNRFILDFLMEEVIDQQPEEMREFLLKTSILRQFSASLCNVLVNRKDSQSILVQAEQANLFLIPLDNERQWYRYHHLFAEHLQKQLKQTQPDCIPLLHRYASKWYTENNILTEAIRHAVDIGDFELAADIVEMNIIYFTDYDEFQFIVQLLEPFPDQLVCSRPWLCIVKAWMLAYTGNSEQARCLLEMAERNISKTGGEEANRQILGHIAAIYGFLFLFGADMALCANKGYEALEYLPESDLYTRISASIILGSALRLDGKFIEAMNVLQEAVTLSRTLKTKTTLIRALSGLAAAQLESGRLQDAILNFNESIKLSEWASPDGIVNHLPAASNAFNRLADIFFMTNEMESALEYVQEGIQLAEKWGRANLIWDGSWILANILLSLGDCHGANLAVQKAEIVSRKISPFSKSLTDALQAQVWLDQGEIDAAIRWARQQNLTTETDIRFNKIDIFKVYVHVLLAQNDIDNAIQILSRMLAKAEKAGAPGYVVAISLDLALTYQKQGKHAEAIGALARAVEIGERIGLIRPFIEHGSSLLPMLQEILSGGFSVEFIKKLLLEIDKELGDKKKYIRIPSQKLIEPLSERELQVLRLLNSALTSEEMAGELLVSVNTIRTHIRNIYSKFDVHGRVEAIQKAKDFGLI
jgi:LuxR family transcriptional regulator, maltose regulon positive regulatory protein